MHAYMQHREFFNELQYLRVVSADNETRVCVYSLL